MKEKQVKYPAKTFKVHPKTVEKLKVIKKKEGKSWNLLFLELIKRYENL